MKIWVTGSNGQLGRSLQKVAAGQPHYECYFTDIAEVDLRDYTIVKKYIQQHHFDVIINCAAYTAVDVAEDDPADAYKINAHVPGNLAKISSEKNIFFLHISTDFVFSGEKKTPYTETDPAFPNSVYGKSKLEGENEIMQYNGRGAIVRTSWLYSSFGNNFVKTILQKAREKNELKVVHDQTGSPTYALDLAHFLLHVLQNLDKLNKMEIFHFSNSGACTWYELALETIEHSSVDCEILPCTSDEYPTKAQRPVYSVLSLEKIDTFFNYCPRHWMDALKDCLRELNH